jgi:acetyl esterase/lipase
VRDAVDVDLGSAVVAYRPAAGEERSVSAREVSSVALFNAAPWRTFRASVAIISPFADLTFSGASIEQRKDLDPYVSHELLESMAADYMGGTDRNDPRSSVVFADLHGLPPLLNQVGENEILYDDATRIRDCASAAGVEVSFESWRYGIHVWPVYVSAGLPESAIAIEHLAAFLRAYAQHGAASTLSTSSTS